MRRILCPTMTLVCFTSWLETPIILPDSRLQDVFVERPGPVIRKMSTYSINLDQDNEVVLQDLKDNGRGAASNFTQKLVRDRRSTRVVKAGSKVQLPVQGES